MQTIVLASSNQGKIKEINQLIEGHAIKVVPQAQFGVEDIEENGLTFIENAILKARHASVATGLPAIADDSGLVVPALGGSPGIYSARYAGTPSDSRKNIEKLLQKLSEVKDRRGYFYSVIVLLRNPKDPCPIISEGKWYGSILTSPKGTQGFGYDPVFFDETLQSSAAELHPEIKNTISHRGQAMQKLLAALPQI